MVGRIGAVEQLLQGGQEIVGHRAAQAAVGQLDDVVIRAIGTAAGLQQLAIDADLAEFVDDQRQPAAPGVAQQVADQRGLAGAEKAGDHGGGNFADRSEEHTSELQSLMRISYAVFCLKKKNRQTQ